MNHVGIMLFLLASPAGMAQSGPTQPGKTPAAGIAGGQDSTGTHDAGRLRLTIDDNGGQQGWRTTAFWPEPGGIDQLYWQWLLIGWSQHSLADGWDGDWATSPGGGLAIAEPGAVADEEGLARFSSAAYGIAVTQRSYAWAAPPDDDYVIFSYTITNTSGSDWESLYVGHRTDFDVGGDHGAAFTDMSDFDSTRDMGYMWDVGLTTHAGLALLEGRFCAYRLGWGTGADSGNYDLLSWPMVELPTPNPDDWCFWVSSGPHALAAGDSVRVAYVMAIGDGLADLQANVDAARVRWQQVGLAPERRLQPPACRLLVRPNPSRPGLTIECEPPAAVAVLDVQGRVVRRFGEATHVSWDGRDDAGRAAAAGTYVVLATRGGVAARRAVVLLR